MDKSSSHQIGLQTYTPLEDEDELKRLCQPKQHVAGYWLAATGGNYTKMIGNQSKEGRSTWPAFSDFSGGGGWI